MVANQRGELIVTLAAYIIVGCFVVKVLIGGLFLGSMLSKGEGNKLDLAAAKEIQVALAK